MNGGQENANLSVLNAVLSGKWRACTLPPEFEVASTALLEHAKQEGVSPLLAWHLQGAVLPNAWSVAFADARRTAAVRSLLLELETRKVATVLAQLGIRTLLLKGNALGQWLYPESWLRPCSDIDLLFESRAEAERAATGFAALGYSLAFSPAASNYEMTCRLMIGGKSRGELDLHWRLVNSPAYAGRFTFEELWSTSIALPVLGNGLKALGPLHALAHACLNRALDLQMSGADPLKLLYDLHLFLQRMDAADWRRFLDLARRKNLCGLCLRSFDDAVAAFDAPLPEEVRRALANHATLEPISGQRLHDWRHMQWHNLKAIPGTWAKLAWLRDKVFPTRTHLRELHGDGYWLQLMWRRGVRGLRRLVG